MNNIYIKTMKKTDYIVPITLLIIPFIIMYLSESLNGINGYDILSQLLLSIFMISVFPIIFGRDYIYNFQMNYIAYSQDKRKIIIQKIIFILSYTFVLTVLTIICYLISGIEDYNYKNIIALFLNLFIYFTFYATISVLMFDIKNSTILNYLLIFFVSFIFPTIILNFQMFFDAEILNKIIENSFLGFLLNSTTMFEVNKIPLVSMYIFVLLLLLVLVLKNRKI